MGSLTYGEKMMIQLCRNKSANLQLVNRSLLNEVKKYEVN